MCINIGGYYVEYQKSDFVHCFFIIFFSLKPAASGAAAAETSTDKAMSIEQEHKLAQLILDADKKVKILKGQLKTKSRKAKNQKKKSRPEERQALAGCDVSEAKYRLALACSEKNARLRNFAAAQSSSERGLSEELIAKILKEIQKTASSYPEGLDGIFKIQASLFAIRGYRENIMRLAFEEYVVPPMFDSQLELIRSCGSLNQYETVNGGNLARLFAFPKVITFSDMTIMVLFLDAMLSAAINNLDLLIRTFRNHELQEKKVVMLEKFYTNAHRNWQNLINTLNILEQTNIIKIVFADFPFFLQAIKSKTSAFRKLSRLADDIIEEFTGKFDGEDLGQAIENAKRSICSGATTINRATKRFLRRRRLQIAADALYAEGELAHNELLDAQQKLRMAQSAASNAERLTLESAGTASFTEAEAAPGLMEEYLGAETDIKTLEGSSEALASAQMHRAEELAAAEAMLTRTKGQYESIMAKLRARSRPTQR